MFVSFFQCVHIMGLREKRTLNEIKTVAQPRYQAELDEAVGWHIPMNLDWDSMPELEAPIEGFIRDQYEYSFALLVKIMKAIVVDDIGKDALRSRVQSILFINYNKTGADTGERKTEIKNGCLEIHCGWGSYSSEYYDNYNNEFQKLIEDLL